MADNHTSSVARSGDWREERQDRRDREEPFFTRRSHTKSRTGCSTCKSHRIRCDEQKPTCEECRKRGRKCGYVQMGSARSERGVTRAIPPVVVQANEGRYETMPANAYVPPYPNHPGHLYTTPAPFPNRSPSPGLAIRRSSSFNRGSVPPQKPHFTVDHHKELISRDDRLDRAALELMNFLMVHPGRLKEYERTLSPDQYEREGWAKRYPVHRALGLFAHNMVMTEENFMVDEMHEDHWFHEECETFFGEKFSYKEICKQYYDVLGGIVDRQRRDEPERLATPKAMHDWYHTRYPPSQTSGAAAGSQVTHAPEDFTYAHRVRVIGRFDRHMKVDHFREGAVDEHHRLSHVPV